MAVRPFDRGRSADKTVIGGLLFMVAAVFVTLLLLALNSDMAQDFPYFFLLPWILALAVVVAVPSLVLYYQGEFGLQNPIVFASVGYFIPAFVVGGLALTTGLSNPYFLVFIQDPKSDLPWTMILIILGFAGLSVGYFLPVGRKIGEIIARYLPSANYEHSAFRVPGLLLLCLGIINSILALMLGLFGFQRSGEIGTYDGLIFLTTLFWMEASFLLWFVIFRSRKLDLLSYFVIVMLIVTATTKAMFAGNRGSLLQIFIFISLAYVLSGKEFRLKQAAWAGLFLAVALIFGTIYGTAFRNVKGSEDVVDAGAYTESVFQTFDEISNGDNASTLGSGLFTLAERLDTVSSLAVVVSNYQQLAPYEENYGLDNNITKDLSTFLIPRIVWNDKPVASESRKYSELYFDYGDNSFAITPIGDLLRNFGVIGVPIGMLVLGLILRTIYRALVEAQPRSLWRSTVYFMLLTAVSYEGFYGSIIPFLVKVGATAIVGILMVCFLAKRFQKGTLAASQA